MNSEEEGCRAVSLSNPRLPYTDGQLRQPLTSPLHFSHVSNTNRHKKAKPYISAMSLITNSHITKQLSRPHAKLRKLYNCRRRMQVSALLITLSICFIILMSILGNCLVVLSVLLVKKLRYIIICPSSATAWSFSLSSLLRSSGKNHPLFILGNCLVVLSVLLVKMLR